MLMKRVKVVVTKISQYLIPLMNSVPNPKSQDRNNLANLMK